MRSPFRSAVFVTALHAAACATSAKPPDAPVRHPLDWRGVVGCYRSGSEHYQLDSIPSVGVHFIELGSRLLRSSTAWSPGDDSYWTISGPDSVRLVIDDGLHGVRWRLRVHGDTLSGREQTLTDLPVRYGPSRFTAVREPCLPADSFLLPDLDSATEAAWSGYGATLPTDRELRADPWRAMAPARDWLQAHPDALRTWAIRWNARAMFDRAAGADVRANARELVGTYRLEVARTGGPTHVFYGRTEVYPRSALAPADTATIIQDRPAGYTLRFTLSRDSSRLPRPGPGRRHRDAIGGNSTANSEIQVRFPASSTADAAKRFHGYVMLVNFIYDFHGADPELPSWEHEWFRGHYHFDRGVNDGAEFVIGADGRVTFTQREELARDRVVVLRGERISGTAWQCARDDC